MADDVKAEYKKDGFQIGQRLLAVAAQFGQKAVWANAQGGFSLIRPGSGKAFADETGKTVFSLDDVVSVGGLPPDQELIDEFGIE